MRPLILLFLLIGVFSCIVNREDEVQYVYDLKIQSENKDVMIDSVEVEVSANDKIILKTIYSKTEIKGGIIKIIFNAKQSDKIKVSYTAYSNDFKILEDSEDFTLSEARKDFPQVNIVKLDSLLIVKITAQNKVPKFISDNSQFPDTVEVGFESKTRVKYESYAAKNLKLKLTGLEEISLKGDSLFILASEKILGTHHIKISLLDSNGNTLDSILWELAILDTNHAPIFLTQPSDIPSTILANVEMKDSLYYEDADGDSVTWTILEGPPWLHLERGVLSYQATNEDTGNVTVHIEIRDGKNKSDSLSFNIEVIKLEADSLEIIEHPQGDSIAAGYNASFSITVRGQGINYQWQKNKIDISGENSQNLILENVPISDSGSFYRCIASNEFGADTSFEAMLEVFKIPKILTSSGSFSLMPGKSQIIRISAEGSNLNFQWQKNGINIENAYSDSLNIGPVDISDNGNAFRCIVSNFLGADTSQTTFLSVTAYNQITDLRDGKTYNTVIIGTQEWMAQNLDYDNSNSDSWCYSDNGNNCNVYGRLYTWDIATSSQNVNGRDICPEGWHLPSNSEWEDLSNYVSSLGYSGREGKALKSVSGWNNDQNGDDIVFFNALPAGYRFDTGEFSGLNVEGGFWTNQSQNRIRSYYYSLNSLGPQFVPGSARMSDAYSVRCLKD